ncbi:hypothetical protein [Chitinimonas sp.]|uniref:hypothetical protein n=1 Tax=Chitinimonas sp. TaxID=1934313 RepID=UPI0035B287F9
MKKEVNADGGQAAGRDVVNLDTNPQTISAIAATGGIAAAGHTVHVNVGNKPTEPLSDAQRKHLNQLVKDLSALTGMPAAYIWKNVHRDFNVSSIKDMTSDHYMEAKKMLEGYIRDVKSAKPVSESTDSKSESTLRAENKRLSDQLDQSAASITKLTTRVSQLSADNRGVTTKLESANRENADLRRQIEQINRATTRASPTHTPSRRLSGLLITLVLCLASAFLATRYARADNQAKPGAPVCFHDAKPFSLGSVIKLPDAELTCQTGASGPAWDRKVIPPTKPQRKPKSKHPKDIEAGTVEWSTDAADSKTMGDKLSQP